MAASDESDKQHSPWKVLGGLLAAGAAAVTIVVGVGELRKDSRDADARAWTSDANGICTAAGQELAAVTEQISQGKTREEQAAAFRDVAAVVSRRNDRLRELSAPKPNREQFERMLNLSDQAMTEILASVDALSQNDQGAGQAAADSAVRHTERVAELASVLGVPRCRLEVGSAQGP